MKNERVRIGVIGAGWWATEYHIPGVLEDASAELVAICDPNESVLQKSAEVYQVKNTYLDYRDMLEKEKPDAAIVVTPHATHYQIARDCLERDCHVLIEKPMTLKARHANELVIMANQLSKVITIGYTFHYYQQSQRAREVIASGSLGAVEYLNCSFASDMTGFLGGKVSEENSPIRYKVHAPSENYNKPEMLGGGQGHLQMTHPIGYLFYVTGLRARRVQAMMSSLGRSVDMIDTINVEFEGGALGVVGGTGNSRHSHRMALAVYCQDGMYLVDTQAQYSAIRHWRDGTPLNGETENLEWNPTARTHHAVTHNFIQAILGNEPNHAPGEIGLRAVELLDAAYQSVQEDGRPILVEELYK